MIIGRGLVASAFVPYFENDPEITVFASGVSRSNETRKEEFLREEELLRACLKTSPRLLYFGSCSVLDPEMINTPYVHHKLQMETLVESSPQAVIFRLPQVVGASPNPTILTNFIYNKIRTGEHFNVWRNARRNLLDVEDIATIVSCLVRTGEADRGIYNVACPFSVSVTEIVETFELVLGRKARYSMIEAGAGYAIDVPEVKRLSGKLGISFDDGYLERTVRKYYAG
jgi:nucleoside-diphosphate-sugar epimerase